MLEQLCNSLLSYLSEVRCGNLDQESPEIRRYAIAHLQMRTTRLSCKCITLLRAFDGIQSIRACVFVSLSGKHRIFRSLVGPADLQRKRKLCAQYSITQDCDLGTRIVALTLFVLWPRFCKRKC